MSESQGPPPPGIGKTHSVCPLCNGSHVAMLFSKEGYSIYRCADCSLRFLNPQPDDGELEAIYNAQYFLGNRDQDGETRVAGMKRATASIYLDLLDRYLGGVRGLLLEIGCGRGEFLLEAQSRGFEVNGVEISPSAAAIANDRLGMTTVSVGAIESVRLPERAFDVVAFSDAIEHVRKPMEFLRRVYGLLKPGGVAFIVTPSLDSWSAKLMGKYWMEYKIEHLYYFNRQTMRLALQRTGFCDIVTRSNVKVLSPDYICNHFYRFPVPVITPFLQSLSKVIPDRLAQHHFRLVASGIVVIGRKQYAGSGS